MRQWLIDLREAKGVDRRQMAERCECSNTMILILEEDGAITHPRIAARIAEEYGITDVAMYNSLIPRDYHTEKIPARMPKPQGEIRWKELTANGFY